MENRKRQISGASLAGIEIFSALGAAERDAIAGLCRGQSYRAGELVISHRDPGREVFFIISGSVRVSIYSSAGKEISFRDMRAGHMFGELSAIDGKPRSAQVSALTAATLAFVTQKDFWTILQAYPGVAEKIFKYLARLVRALTDRVVDISTLGVRNRIHAELLRLGQETGSGLNEVAISPAPRHAEIAHRVSTHREAVTRELGGLVRQGIIGKARNALIIRDMDRLGKMVLDVLRNET